MSSFIYCTFGIETAYYCCANEHIFTDLSTVKYLQCFDAVGTGSPG